MELKITVTGGVLSLAKSGDNPQFTQEEANAVVRQRRIMDFGSQFTHMELRV